MFSPADGGLGGFGFVVSSAVDLEPDGGLGILSVAGPVFELGGLVFVVSSAVDLEPDGGLGILSVAGPVFELGGFVFAVSSAVDLEPDGGLGFLSVAGPVFELGGFAFAVSSAVDLEVDGGSVSEAAEVFDGPGFWLVPGVSVGLDVVLAVALVVVPIFWTSGFESGYSLTSSSINFLDSASVRSPRQALSSSTILSSRRVAIS